MSARAGLFGIGCQRQRIMFNDAHCPNSATIKGINYLEDTFGGAFANIHVHMSRE